MPKLVSHKALKSSSLSNETRRSAPPRSAIRGRKTSKRVLKPGNASSSLIGEISAILPELDEAGLSFLLDQARLRRYSIAAERRGLEAAKDARGSHRLAGSAERGLRIDRSADGATYHIISGETWKMFTAEETAAMVRISRLDEPEPEAKKDLHGWFSRERRDVLQDLKISGAGSPRIRELLELLRETFPVRSAPRS